MTHSESKPSPQDWLKPTLVVLVVVVGLGAVGNLSELLRLSLDTSAEQAIPLLRELAFLQRVILKVAEIDAIEAAGKYVVVHSGKENHILRETLTALESQLDPNHFLRISRSAIVNHDHIRELQPMFKGEHIVLLHNGLKLAMTRGLREVEHLLNFS